MSQSTKKKDGTDVATNLHDEPLDLSKKCPDNEIMTVADQDEKHPEEDLIDLSTDDDVEIINACNIPDCQMCRLFNRVPILNSFYSWNQGVLSMGSQVPNFQNVQDSRFPAVNQIIELARNNLQLQTSRQNFASPSSNRVLEGRRQPGSNQRLGSRPTRPRRSDRRFTALVPRPQPIQAIPNNPLVPVNFFNNIRYPPNAQWSDIVNNWTYYYLQSLLTLRNGTNPLIIPQLPGLPFANTNVPTIPVRFHTRPRAIAPNLRYVQPCEAIEPPRMQMGNGNIPVREFLSGARGTYYKFPNQ